MTASGNRPPEFAVTECAIDDLRHVVAVRGELDLFSAPALKDAVVAAVEAGRIGVIVDLTETTFMDSSVAGVLVAVLKRIRRRGGALAIVIGDEVIARFFEIRGMDQVFTIVATRAEAIEAVRSTGED
jgi:anti-sigma B factor antagonist